MGSRVDALKIDDFAKYHHMKAHGYRVCHSFINDERLMYYRLEEYVTRCLVLSCVHIRNIALPGWGDVCRCGWSTTLDTIILRTNELRQPEMNVEKRIAVCSTPSHPTDVTDQRHTPWCTCTCSNRKIRWKVLVRNVTTCLDSIVSQNE